MRLRLRLHPRQPARRPNGTRHHQATQSRKDQPTRGLPRSEGGAHNTMPLHPIFEDLPTGTHHPPPYLRRSPEGYPSPSTISSKISRRVPITLHHIFEDLPRGTHHPPPYLRRSPEGYPSPSTISSKISRGVPPTSGGGAPRTARENRTESLRKSAARSNRDPTELFARTCHHGCHCREPYRGQPWNCGTRPSAHVTDSMRFC